MYCISKIELKENLVFSNSCSHVTYSISLQKQCQFAQIKISQTLYTLLIQSVVIILESRFLLACSCNIFFSMKIFLIYLFRWVIQIVIKHTIMLLYSLGDFKQKCLKHLFNYYFEPIQNRCYELNEKNKSLEKQRIFHDISQIFLALKG